LKGLLFSRPVVLDVELGARLRDEVFRGGEAQVLAVVVRPSPQRSDRGDSVVLVSEGVDFRHLTRVWQIFDRHHLVHEIGQEGAVVGGEGHDLRFGEFEFHINNIDFFEGFVNGIFKIFFMSKPSTR